MRRTFVGLVIATLTIGTTVTLTNANAFDRFKKGDYDVTAHPTPTWEPTWSPTWSPEPRVPAPASTSVDPAPAYHAYPTSGNCLSGEQVAGYLRGAGFPEDIIPTMLLIADRESGMCPGALNPVSSACGLLQIWPYREGCLDPARNAAMGYAKYVAAGYSLSPWAMTAP